MKKVMILMLALMSAGAVYGQTKQRIAVYVTGGNSGDNTVFGAKLRDAIIESNKYEAVERTEAFLEQLRKEVKYQQSGNVNDNDLARLGKQSGVKYVCVAELTPVRGGSFATARLIDVERSFVISSADGAQMIKDLPSLISMSASIASSLLESADKYQYVGKKESVAVYVSGKETELQKVLGAKLVSGITNSEKYVAMERTEAFLEQLRKEVKYQQSGNVNDDDLVRLGKLSGVKYVCVAELTAVKDGSFATARLIDVERASVISSADGAEMIKDLPSLISMGGSIASNLVQSADKYQYGEEKESVAVYVSGGETELQKVLGVKLVSAITKSKKYVAMERTDAFLTELRKEQSFQQSGNVDESQLAKLGKQFGVKYVCAARIATSYGSQFLDAILIDVETSIVKASANGALTNSDLRSLIRISNKVANKLLDNEEEIIEMVYVQGGTFTMGCTSEQGNCDSDEKPAHQVTLSSYYISKYEVTQAQWEEIMGNNPSSFKGDDLPVENVSWDDVQKFITRLNAETGKSYRLPTEAEWEYAARGGNQSGGYKYSGSNSVGSVAWYNGNSGATTHPVGTKQANELGIYDMSGNVYEWCYDWYGTYSASAQRDPMGASSGSYRVFRGGSWSYRAAYCRVSDRDYYSPGNRSYNLGFRLACSSK